MDKLTQGLLLDKNQVKDFKKQFQYIKDNAFYLFTCHPTRQEREKIFKKTGLSLSQIRKILLRSRMIDLSNNSNLL